METDGDSAAKERRPGFASCWRDGIGRGAVLDNAGSNLDNAGALVDDAGVERRREEDCEGGVAEAQTATDDSTGLLKNRTIAKAFQILMKPYQARQMV